MRGKGEVAYIEYEVKSSCANLPLVRMQCLEIVGEIFPSFYCHFLFTLRATYTTIKMTENGEVCLRLMPLVYTRTVPRVP